MSMINIAFSGLQAAQVGMNVTSMNIANLLTPGYSRQGIIQSSIGPMGGSGFYRRERGTGRQYSPHLQSVSG
ncbi:flagellar hook-associated protein FlgK [Citrobacter koseri]|uniref:Flagellar hook-associated protein FlgK n=1 Tax=Citrobacter koseri TaxID=545 RepID=A0A2X2X7I7_CITKO|nr:flagellar hook-associated protein FlgK [Citrobacter koseri]